MCRFAAWKGPPRPLSALTHDPPLALIRQSWEPRHMLEAKLNADGAGVAWYPDDGTRIPARYRSAFPLWSDENLASMAPRIVARTAIAIVRSATPGLGVCVSNTPPFVHDELTFAHNGYLRNFHRVYMRPIREALSDETYATVVGGTDSEHVFALLLERLDGARDLKSLVEATRWTLGFCAELARTNEARAALNLVVGNGDGLVAARYGECGDAPSLFMKQDEGCTISSEPLDEDGAWREVPSQHLVVVGEGGDAELLPV